MHVSEVIVERYANILSSQDVIKLFDRLQENVGSRLEAAKLCGLERKTVYDWEKTGEIRLRTKKKVLAALIENLVDETLEFMTHRGVETSVDILRIYLTSLYETAVAEEISKTAFQQLVSKFEEAKKQYSGLIIGHLESEIENMLHSLSEKALALEVQFDTAPLDLVRLSSLSAEIPILIRTISTVAPFVPDTEIAKIFNFPKEFVQSFHKALQENYIAIRLPPALPTSPSSYEFQPVTAGTTPLQGGLIERPEEGMRRLVGT